LEQDLKRLEGRVLIIDDEELIRSTQADILREQGLEVSDGLRWGRRLAVLPKRDGKD
jgi:DNA-binding NtrC family response regulator